MEGGTCSLEVAEEVKERGVSLVEKEVMQR